MAWMISVDFLPLLKHFANMYSACSRKALCTEGLNAFADAASIALSKNGDLRCT